MSELKLPRLLAAAKEFNVGQDTLLDTLAKRGFDKYKLTPTTKLSVDMYYALKEEFKGDEQAKKIADQVEMPEAKSVRKPFQTLALSLVQKCLEEKEISLELGNCGLTDEDFEVGSELDFMLRKCIHLEELILSNKWSISGTDVFKRSLNSEKPNRLYNLPPFLSTLTNLKMIICAGDEIKNWGIRNLNFVSNFNDLHYLDLSYNKIVEIDPLIERPNLRILNLRHNQIKEAIFLNHFPNLEILLLGNNAINNNYELENLYQLKHLEFRNNKIEILRELNQLVSLEILDLSGNEIIDIGDLNDIDTLKHLDLSFNKISKINGLSGLIDLKVLNLSVNNLNTIECLEELPSLKVLDLSVNHIREIEGLNLLTQIESIYLNNNNINEIRGLDNLSSLTLLNLNYNRIDKIGGLVNSKALSYLDLEGNEVNDVSQILHLENLQIVNLTNNPVLDNIPEEVIQVGWKAIRDRLLAGNLTTIKEVKLLLLGNTNVGKSNLLEYLEKGKEPEGNESTHGIQYKILDNLIKGTKIHCWDFGGQEYFHATHQLFFSPGALHIIL